MDASLVKVFSYRRFSSGRQAHGHSMERQIESARRWCRENGYTLDEKLALADLGVSAYKGDNVSRGALSGFIAAIKSRKVPKGSILLVESLDRLSRAALPEAIGLLTEIVRAGVRVVSMIDGREWNQKTIEDTMQFMLSVILFSRAHEESSTKAKRVSATFQSKRNSGQAVVSVMHGGGWVRPCEDKSGWELIEDRADSVKKVFEYAASGHGGVSIARIANTECWPMPWRTRKTTKHWEHTGISRLLRDRRVIGEWQPRRIINGKLSQDGDPVRDYFPSVISTDLWHRTQAALRGRPGPDRRARGVFADVFTGLLWCWCGVRMERKSASSRGCTRYYCLNRKAGNTLCPSIDEESLVQTIFRNLGNFEERAFRDDTVVEALKEKIKIAEEKVSDAIERAKRIVLAIEEGGSIPSLTERLQTVEAEQHKARQDGELARLELDKVPLMAGEFSRDLAAQALEWIDDRSCVEQRHKLATALNRVVKSITVYEKTKTFGVVLKDDSAVGLPILPRLHKRKEKKQAKRRNVRLKK